ncbi:MULTISPECIES: alpha-glucosidase [unclassified Sphingopyxis]|uniref:alpha-glucosidase n=1 Tax=unclassified Sphingopyxis TaxID=2614943 RepID=UPI0025E31A05|nr:MULTISPECIES: alpha-glucosidase [unclassified Sphingopyxis]
MNAEFRAQDDGFDLVAGALTLLRHRGASPAITAAVGDPDVVMIRGNFRMEDRRRDLAPLPIIDVMPDRVEMRSHAGAPSALTLSLVPLDGGFALNVESHIGDCNRLAVELVAQPHEHVWGGGEQMSYLRLNGRRFPIWTSEPGVGRDKDRELTQIMDREGMAGGDYWTTNYPQPTFLSSHRYACHLTSTAYAVLDFSDPAANRIAWWEGCGRIEFTFADDLPTLVEALSSRFGRQPKLPDWAIGGAIVGLKQGMASFDRLHKIREAGAVVSGLWCEDWVGIRETSFGRRLFWDWRWSAARYPDLPGHVARLRADGIRFLGYVNPYLAIDGGMFTEAREQGFLALRLDSDEPYIVDFGEFDCGIVDFTNPAAAAWFADRVIGREMLDIGIAGWMADFGEYLPTDLRLHDGSDPMLAHNRWPVLWAEVNARAIAAKGMTGDALFFMRAGHSGVQAHCPLLWAGDQCVDFSRHDGIGTVITAALSAGLVGNAYSHSDVGGYTSLHGFVRTTDLLKRWAELGAFSPVMRTHEGNRPDDNLQIDSTPDILHHFAAMTRVHAALAPYLRSLCDEAVERGLPLQRPLFLHYPTDACYACEDQYLLGGDLLVAPIIHEGGIDREVLIPADDEWVHVWTGDMMAAGRCKVSGPFGAPPVFYRAGSAFAPLFQALSEHRGLVG